MSFLKLLYTGSQGSIYRKEIKEKYGRKATFPFMEDPNKGNLQQHTTTYITHNYAIASTIADLND